MNLKNIQENTIKLIKEVGIFIRTEAEKFDQVEIEEKGTNNLVSYVDKTAEELLIKGLLKILPDSGMIAEEETTQHIRKEYNWIIDPLDGTTNFIHSAPPYAISVALENKDMAILGVVYEISADECFHAIKGEGAYLDKKQIHVSDVNKVSSALIATGFPYINYDRLEPFMKSLDYFFHYSHGIRRLGSAATDLSYVACGRYDAFYEYNLNPWDVAAGSLLVSEAGGKVSDFTGGNNFLFGKEIIACNTKMYNEFQKYIEKIFC